MEFTKMRSLYKIEDIYAKQSQDDSAQNKGMGSIYNVLGLRISIPQGNPLGIGVTAALPSSLTQSIDSVDYVGNFIYEKGQLKRYMFDDGYLRLNTNNTCVPRFFIKDHLGNNRILTDGSGNIKQNTNYYPYGGMTSISTGQGEQQFKYNGKEYDPMHGLNEYDYGARQYDPAIGKFTTMDPLCEKYYHISPYAYCGGNPVNAVDPDGRSTWVTQFKNDQYQVVGGDLKDGDRNIYVGTFQNGIFVPERSIGITTSITSFYDSDEKQWKNSIINLNDKSGDDFLSMIITNNPPLFDDYIVKARHKQPYDFKLTNGTNKVIKGIDVYRGMPIGMDGEGRTIFSSARDIGNIAAGYIAGVNGMSWEASRIALDSYQGSIEGISTRNAEYYGWKMGYNNSQFGKNAYNLRRSINSLFKSIWNYLF